MRAAWVTRALTAAAVLLLTVGGPAPQVRAAPTPAPSDREPAPDAPFGVRAGLYGLTTLPGEHFTYSLKAGARIRDSAVLYNQSDEPRTFHVYGADVTHAAGGGLAPAQAGRTMTGVGAWLRLRTPATVTVKPRSRKTVAFSLAVPAGTPPGSYVGGLVTSLSTPAVSGGVNTETRIARLVDLTVPGRADLRVTLSKLTVRHTAGAEVATVTVRNTGNVLYTFTGHLAVAGGGTRTVRLSPKGLYVIPGGSATVTGRLTDLPLIGRRRITATVTATVPGGEVKTLSSNTVRRTYVPWLLVIIVALCLAVLVTVLVATRKRWRARLRRRGTERAAVRALRRELRSDARAPSASADEPGTPAGEDGHAPAGRRRSGEASGPGA